MLFNYYYPLFQVLLFLEFSKKEKGFYYCIFFTFLLVDILEFNYGFYLLFIYFYRNDNCYFITQNQTIQKILYKLGGLPTKLAQSLRIMPL